MTTTTTGTGYDGRHVQPGPDASGTDVLTGVAGPSVPAPRLGDDDSAALGGLAGDDVEDDGVFADPAVVEDADVEGRSLSLFEGDQGSLSYEERRALVFLLRHQYVSAERNPEEWEVIVAAQGQLRSRLNDMFLDLHLDPLAQVAFKRQAVPDGDGRFPTLLRDIVNTREETILLIFLRQRFRSERADGTDAVMVERQEMLDAVVHFRPREANDQSGDTKRAARAIESLQKSGILLKTADEQRLRIAAVIEVLLPLPRLRELLDTLLALNAASGGEPDAPVPDAGGDLPEPGTGEILAGLAQRDLTGEHA